MDEFVKSIIEKTPDLAGLALLAWVLWRQNTKMLDALMARIVELEKSVQEVNSVIQTMAYNAGHGLQIPPHVRPEPQIPKQPPDQPDRVGG